MEPHVFIHAPTQEEFIHRGTTFLAECMREAIAERGRCVMGLSGGSTPRVVYEALAHAPDIDWSQVTVFLADDRYIHKGDPDSNQMLLESTLLRSLPVRPHLCLPDTSKPLEQCVAEYDACLQRTLADGPADIVTIGMGSDGHIASLFPPLETAAFGPAAAIHTQTDNFPIRDRISVTLPVLQSAEAVLWMLKGGDKRHVWDAMLASDEGAERWPGKTVLGQGTSTVVAWW